MPHILLLEVPLPVSSWGPVYYFLQQSGRKKYPSAKPQKLCAQNSPAVISFFVAGSFLYANRALCQADIAGLTTLVVET